MKQVKTKSSPLPRELLQNAKHVYFATKKMQDALAGLTAVEDIIKAELTVLHEFAAMPSLSEFQNKTQLIGLHQAGATSAIATLVPELLVFKIISYGVWTKARRAIITRSLAEPAAAESAVRNSVKFDEGTDNILLDRLAVSAEKISLKVLTALVTYGMVEDDCVTRTDFGTRVLLHLIDSHAWVESIKARRKADGAKT